MRSLRVLACRLVSGVDDDGRKAATRRFLIALGVSLLLHLVLLARYGLLSSSALPAHGGSLQVRLTGPAWPAAAAHATSQPPATRVAALSRRELDASQRKVTPPVARSVTENAATAIVEAPAAVTPPAAKAPARTESAAALENESPATEPSSGIPWLAPNSPPQRVEIGFLLFSGADRQPLGTGRHVYTSQNGDSYGVSVEQTLASDETAGDRLWQMGISGRINRQGLRPELFRLQGAVPERLMALKNVAARADSLAGKERSGRMSDGILDRQSLFYQFMLVPPLESGGKLWLSDDTAYGNYSYRIEGFEPLHIEPLGDVRTVKMVLSSSDSAEIIELWLLPDAHYLPARMRHTDVNGVITEQLVVSLDFR